MWLFQTYAKDISGKKLKCLQRCELQTETLLTTTSTYPNKQTFAHRPDFCLLLQKLGKICNDSRRATVFESNQNPTISCIYITNIITTNQLCDSKDKVNVSRLHSDEALYDFMFNYARNNLAVLNVFIKDPYYTKIRKDEQMSFTTFVGNAGGLAGLCMGMSLVSIFEVLYHCTNVCFAYVFKSGLQKITPKRISKWNETAENAL